MRFSDDLFWSAEFPDEEAKRTHILNKLRSGDFPGSFYVIYLNKNTGKPECMRSFYFMQKYLQTTDFLVLGLVKNLDRALEYLAEYECKQRNVIYDSNIEDTD